MGSTLEMWDEMSRKVPALVAVAPSGPHVLYDFHKMGGVPVVMKKIASFLDLSCPTVTGQTVGENLATVIPTDSDVIRSLDNPVWSEGALAILKGNLAPAGRSDPPYRGGQQESAHPCVLGPGL